MDDPEPSAGIQQMHADLLALTTVVLALCESHRAPALLLAGFTRHSEQAIAGLLATNPREAYVAQAQIQSQRFEQYLRGLAGNDAGRNPKPTG